MIKKIALLSTCLLLVGCMSDAEIEKDRHDAAVDPLKPADIVTSKLDDQNDVIFMHVPNVWSDPETGCQYLVNGNAITPRMMVNTVQAPEKQMGCK